jgi:parvulin-like peptidyl-prolyl isomerase
MTSPLPIRRIASAAAFAALTACAAPAAAQAVARVNGTPITNEQLDRAFNDVLRERKLNISRMQDPAKARELKRVALDRLIQEELFWQQAQKENLVVADAEVEKSYAESMSKFPSRQAFEVQLIRQGTDEKGFRSDIRRLLSADRYAERVVDQRTKVTDADVAAFYRANAHLFEKPEMLKVRTIALAVPASKGSEERRAARLRLEVLRQELAAGGDFDRAARQVSDDPTRQWGGELDPAPLDALPEWMRSPVAKLKPGGISPVIETAGGLHLLKLDARIPATQVSLAQATPSIREHLQSTRGREALDAAAKELRAAAKVEVLVPL